MQIESLCTDPPRGLLWQVRRVLRCIDREHLQGLAFVCLLDQMPEKVTEGEPDAHVYGWYHVQSDDIPPYVVLYIPRIYAGLPSFLWWSTVPTLRLARSLAHEIAHHLRAERGYVFQPQEHGEDEEAIANRYAATLVQRMAKRWAYKLGVWGTKESWMALRIRECRLAQEEILRRREKFLQGVGPRSGP